MEIKIVLGTLFGDEGKGNTVQWLCKKAISEGKGPLVVRYSGGPQAGHTVRHNGITHVCSSYGSGVLLGVPTLYIGGLIDPLCVANEKKALEDKGVKVPPLFASEEVPLITPYDVADQQKWAEYNPHRTCGKGVMSAVLRENDFFSEYCINVSELSTEGKIHNALQDVAYYYKARDKSFDVSLEILNRWEKSALKLGKSIRKYNVTDYDVFIFEGTQGLLLDAEYGYYPYITSTKVGLNGIPECYLYDAEVYLVSRTYITRHGAMGEREGKWFREDRQIDIPATKLETNVTNEFQGDFITALWYGAPYREAVHRHHLDTYMRKYDMKFNLVVTHMDVKEAAGDSKMIRESSNTFFPHSIKMNLEDAGLSIRNIYTSDNPDSDIKLLYSHDN